MAGGSDKGPELVLETDRLLLRPWRVSEASIQREMWAERDPRVPPHRRIDAEGRPAVTDFEEAIRSATGSSLGLLAVEPKGMGAAVGYCGLVDSGRELQEPELAFELLRRSWGQGYATEASWAVLRWATTAGYGGSGPPSGNGTPPLVGCWRRSGSPRPSGRRLPTGPTASPRGSSELLLASDPTRREGQDVAYCRDSATRRRSEGSMKWSWSSVPTSSWTQCSLPVNRESRAL